MPCAPLFRTIRDDLRYHGGSSWKRSLLIAALDPSFRLLLNCRIGHWITSRPRRWKILGLWSIFLKFRQHTRYGCAISYEARLGQRVRFAHPLGVVIGRGAEVGDDVTIWQHVTLGSHGRSGEREGYPVIEDGVRVFANAVILGNVTIGRDATVAASAVVAKDVPAGRVAAGSPATVRG